jgi:small ligand-binding sensory domain FIST
MTVAQATSTDTDSVQAAREVVESVREKLGGERPDLAFYFVSTHHLSQLEAAARTLAADLGAPHLLGCTGETIIGGEVEYENQPAFSLWAGTFPTADIRSAHLTLEQTLDGFAFLGIPEIPSGPATLLLLGEPYTFPTDAFIKRMAEDYPELQVLGGMSSGASSAGENRLFLGSDVLVDGAVAAVVSGGTRVRPLVSQGCRPFGKRLVITKAEQNFILELGGRPALEKLREQLQELTPHERGLLERGPHVGIAIDAGKEQYRRGDFLVRNIIGIRSEDGAIAITDMVKPGLTIQYHLRDADTASEDLQLLLGEAGSAGAQPHGALLFSCNGRGRRLFDVANHDAGTVSRELGPIPLAGFFAAGEIGPVGGQNFLHGFTASLALFEESD